MIVEDARERLAHHFQDASRIDVRLVWDPAWKPDFITARGQELLGRTPRNAV
jgi:metal-sulfur cluster biosynthetic enzyme